MSELDPQIHEQIKALCAEGDELQARGQFEAALAKYDAAFFLLPKPAHWAATTWIYTAIGETLFLMGKYDEAINPLISATMCPGGAENPFIHLTLGKAEFELGRKERALDALARAYMLGGKEIFDEEESKYFDLVKANLRRPPAGW